MVTDSNISTGCYGISNTLNVTIQAKPSTFISGANNICVMGTAMYGTINNINKFYDWNVVGGNIDFGQGTSNITVTWLNAGVGYVYLTDSLIGGNCSASTFLGVQVNPKPSAAFTATQSAGGVKLTPVDNSVSCKWYFGDGDSSYQFSPYHAYASNGLYTILLQAKSTFGCLNESTTDVDISTVGLFEEANGGGFKFAAHPNPFNEQTKLSLTIKESAEISLEVFDMSGRLIHTYLQGQLYLAGSYEFGFNSANFHTSGGVYLVRVKVNEEYRHLRIIELGR
jgi:PKD repeat protein